MNITSVAFLLFGLIAGLLAFMGLLSAVKGTPVRAVGTMPSSPQPPTDSRAFRDGMELVSKTTLLPGHHVEVFINGDQTYPRLWEDLRAARESITMQMYYCEEGRMADTLSEILCERAHAGVKVMLLYDAFGSSFKKTYLEGLQKAGVKAESFRPLKIVAIRTMQNRAHMRVVCIDGRIGYTGGFGISDKWFGNGRDKDQWRDTNVRFTGPGVRQLQAGFVACWAEATGDLLVGDMLFPPIEQDTSGAVAGLMHCSPSVGSTEAERFFALSIASARKRLYITNSYFVPDKEFRQLIAGAARRGVDTRVLTAGMSSDVKSTLYASRARYEELLEAGVRIYEYRETMMHAKTLVVDGQWSAAGSMNADNRSLSFNEETVLMMLDDGLGSTMEQHFLEDITHADEIDLATFRKRGVMDRMKEHATHLVWRVL